MQHLPNAKILALLIVCMAIVGSVWLFQRHPDGVSTPVVVESALASTSTSADFPKNWVMPDEIATASTTTTVPYSGEGTVTDQISKDFFSQYLILLKQGGDVSDADANQIAQNTLSNPDYLKATGVVYVAKDLHIRPTTSKELVAAYGQAMTNIVNKHAAQDRIDPMAITKKAFEDQNAAELAALDPAIASEKATIKDLLAIQIPSDAVTVHLAFLNAASTILSNTEAFRASFTDPVKGFVALSQFPNHQKDMLDAIKAVADYIHSK